MDPDKDATATDLVKAALNEARELVELEVALARTEVESELTGVRSAAIAFAVATLASSVALSMVLFAVAFATHAEVAVSVAAAAVLGAIAGICAATGYRKMPTSILGRTRKRLGEGFRDLEERAHGT